MLTFLTILAFSVAAVLFVREADIEGVNPPRRRIVANHQVKLKFFDAITSATH